MQAACDAPSCRQAGGSSRRQGTAATAGHHRQDKQRPQGCKPPCSRGACAPSGNDARTSSSAQGPASRGSQTPALPKGRARQGVPEDRLQGRLDGPQDGWSGWRLVGVSGLRPGLESPLLRHWRSGTGRRRKDEGEACRQALPRRCQTGACPGRQLRSLWDAVPEAGQRLADAADSRRGRKGCMPEQTATGAGFRQSASGAMATGTAQERGWLAGGTSSPLPASKAILVLGKQGQHASRLRDKAGFLPAPVQARSRAGPEPGQSRSRPAPEFLQPPSAVPQNSLGSPAASFGQPRTGPGQPWAVPSRAGSSSCSSRQFPKSNAVTGSAGSRGPFRLQARDQLTHAGSNHAGNEPMRKAEEARPAGTWSWRMALRHPQRPGGDAAQACRAWLRRLRQEQGPDLRRQDR